MSGGEGGYFSGEKAERKRIAKLSADLGANLQHAFSLEFYSKAARTLPIQQMQFIIFVGFQATA